jgi:hypothetical protein
MGAVTPTSSSSRELHPDPQARLFYRHVLDTLEDSKLPFLVGGAYAYHHYTGIHRYTKDLDIFIFRRDYERVSEALRQAGHRSELTYPHWLAKVYDNGSFVDLIFSSGNGVAEVDEAWFDHAEETEVMGVRTKINPVEEMIWSKAFIMERERYDGADIAHLLQARGGQLDWNRLLHRFGPHWRILLSHLVLFGFIYADCRDLIPAQIMDELLERLRRENREAPPQDKICGGTLLSREQYLNDIQQQGLQDCRVVPHGNMTKKQAAIWTKAIDQTGEES